jgi:hypothetical protein
MPAVQETVDRVRRIDVDQYRYGFETLIESDKAPRGLSEDTVRFISAKKNEPAWMLEWRLEAYRRWLTMTEPDWARVHYPKIDYQDLYYYSAPKKKELASLDEVDPEILKTYEKLGIPLREQEMLAGVVRPEGERRIAVDAVFDSVSVATTFQKELKQAGVIFMPISEAIREHPELVRKYLGTVVPTSDNYFATLNLRPHLVRWHKIDNARSVQLRAAGIMKDGEQIRFVVNRMTDGQPLAGKIRSAWEGILEDAGLGGDVVRHSLRHTAATWLMQAGVDLWEAAGWLGMTVEQLEANYGHHHPEFQEEAAEAFGGRR